MNSKTFKALRIKEGYSQADFATLLGVSESTVAAIETNRRPMSAKVKVRLAQQYELNDEMFLFFDEYEKYQ